MYPNTYVSLFPPFPRDNRVFVAMSFDPRFNPRWEHVIVPAVRRIEIGGIRLEAHRVDLRKTSDSVLTEILDGISRCRFFLADITVIGELDDRPVRNANVLYEVGLAHATRLPEEIALLRSDNKELVFDVMNVRVLEYDPDHAPQAARDFVVNAIAESLRELDLRRSLTVRRVAESLDADGWFLLFEAVTTGVVRHPVANLASSTRRQAIGKLLETGALRAEITKLTPDLLTNGDAANRRFQEIVAYRPTELGLAVAQYGGQRLGFESPEIQRVLRDAPGADESGDREST